MSGGRERASILADAFESVLGAYYLDQGMEAARVFLLGLMKAELDFICTHGICSDFKTRLQEVAQQDGDVDIVYELIGSKVLNITNILPPLFPLTVNISVQAKAGRKRKRNSRLLKALLKKWARL